MGLKLPHYDNVDFFPTLLVTAGEALAAGELVTISGWDATNGCYKVAKTDADATVPTIAYFVADTAISSGAQGYVVGQKLLSGVDTSSATAQGDPVYTSGTAGAWTLTAVTGAGKVVQPVGIVTVKATAANGGAVLLFPFMSKPRTATS